MSFIEIPLSNMLNEFGKDDVQKILSEFVCTDNIEVEDFIRSRAINHERRGMAKTVIVYDSIAHEICAYYTISIKSFVLNTKISTRYKKKYFGTSQIGGNIIPSILIGQLGKNENIKSSFTGSDLMNLIFRYIIAMSKLTPSVICYVEHNGSKKLISYYEKHDFVFLHRDEEKDTGMYCHIIKTKDVLDKVGRI